MRLIVFLALALAAPGLDAEQPAPPLTVAALARMDIDAQGKTITATVTRVCNTLADDLLSKNDAKDMPKSAERLAADMERADLVLAVGREFDASELTLRIHVAERDSPSLTLDNAVMRYVVDEVKKREAAAKARQRGPSK